MTEACYSISEASQELNVEAHVLRYWEEELELKVPRNELGHRFYTERLMRTIQKIKELRKDGVSLKDVKDILQSDPTLYETHLLSPKKAELSEISEDRLLRFQDIMTDIFSEAMCRASDQLCDRVCEQITKRMDVSFEEHARQEEAHFRQLDAALRGKASKKKELTKSSWSWPWSRKQKPTPEA